MCYIVLCGHIICPKCVQERSRMMDELEMYRRMYAILCVAASRAVEEMDEFNYGKARKTLTQALELAEGIYMNTDREE